MCGVAGLVTFRADNEAALLARARAMAQCMIHRGPDAGGAWADPEAGFATGHRRLSILDLSDAGAQPMLSAGGRYVISYNGEIYNADELRPALEAKGIRFRGHSDTEVILEAFAAWGVEATVSRLIGMFVIALWDRETRCLWLIRDRLGIKPLYWGRFGDLFLFASELKGLRADGGWPVEYDRAAMTAYCRFSNIPSPMTIYRGVNKLPPGCILRLQPGREPEITRYWSLSEVVAAGRAQPFTGTDQDAEQCLVELLGDAVRRRMVADVPLGAFLSGGINSSTVVALMQQASSSKVRTFSIGFTEKDYDEAPYAKAVAGHFGTHHTELYVTPDEARDVIPRLPDIYDEPFANSSQIPTFLVSELTRRHVTVALSGDGGDEVFCGYNRYFLANMLRSRLLTIPRPLRSVGSQALTVVPPAMWDAAFRVVPHRWRPPHAGDKLHKLARVLMEDEDNTYLQLLSHWHAPEQLVIGGREPQSIVIAPENREVAPDYTERMQYVDTLTYLPDDILTKVDRASMAVSLEVRVPFIDHRVVALAWSLPHHMRIRNGRGKWIVRQLLRRFLPQDLIERPKMGFGVPIDSWLRGSLREWAEDLLSEESLRRTGLRSEPIRARWNAHLTGRENWQYPLWTVLMMQAWMARHA